MGQYADDVIDGLVDQETGEFTDEAIAGETPGYPRSPTADGDFLSRLRSAVTYRGFSLRKCHNTHFQVCDEHGPLLNVWPTTRKYLEFDAAKGMKARRGTVEEIVRRAARLRLHRKPIIAPAVQAAAPAPVDDDPFADNHPDYARPELEPAVLSNCSPQTFTAPLRPSRAAEPSGLTQAEAKTFRHLLTLAAQSLLYAGGNLNVALAQEIQNHLS